MSEVAFFFSRQPHKCADPSFLAFYVYVPILCRARTPLFNFSHDELDKPRLFQPVSLVTLWIASAVYMTLPVFKPAMLMRPFLVM